MAPSKLSLASLEMEPLVVEPEPSGEKQQRIQLTLQEIFEQNGRVEARLLIEAAKNPHHRMHDDFDWNVERNAERWLIHQAEMYIVSVKVSFKEDGPDYRMMYSVKLADGERAFVPYATAFGVTENRKQVLDKAVRTLKLVRDRYKYLQELARVFAEIDRF